MNELPIGLLFTASRWSQQQVKGSTVSRHWNRFFQNCMLYKNITLASGNLSEEPVIFPFLAVLSPEGSSEPSESLTAVAFYMNSVESSWLIRGVMQSKQVEQCRLFFFHHIHWQMMLSTFNSLRLSKPVNLSSFQFVITFSSSKRASGCIWCS